MARPQSVAPDPRVPAPQRASQFKQKKTAKKIIKEAREVILAMVDIYCENFELDEIITNSA